MRLAHLIAGLLAAVQGLALPLSPPTGSSPTSSARIARRGIWDEYGGNIPGWAVAELAKRLAVAIPVGITTGVVLGKHIFQPKPAGVQGTKAAPPSGSRLGPDAFSPGAEASQPAPGTTGASLTPPEERPIPQARPRPDTRTVPEFTIPRANHRLPNRN